MHDDGFKEALALRRIPSEETLRERFDRHAEGFADQVGEGARKALEDQACCNPAL